MYISIVTGGTHWYAINITENAGMILCMCPVNGKWCYIVTSSLIGWGCAQNYSWKFLSRMVLFVEVLVSLYHLLLKSLLAHDDIIEWKPLPGYWPFERGIHRSPVNSPHKGQWHGALMLSLICAQMNSWVNTREAGDYRCHHAHYDVTVM